MGPRVGWSEAPHPSPMPPARSRPPCTPFPARRVPHARGEPTPAGGASLCATAAVTIGGYIFFGVYEQCMLVLTQLWRAAERERDASSEDASQSLGLFQ
eukprot:7126656-Prymnesium_polylepis.1